MCQIVPLTLAESEIVNLLRLGYTCRQASARLGISDNTGWDRIRRAQRRMECDTIAQMVGEYAVLRMRALMTWRDMCGGGGNAAMTDKELLKAAARAAGMTLRWYTYFEKPFAEDVDSAEDWNPLTDDGDALRLAVALCLAVSVAGHAENVTAFDDFGHQVYEDLGRDARAATRRAIVRIAAAIGSSHNAPLIGGDSPPHRADGYLAGTNEGDK